MNVLPMMERLPEITPKMLMIDSCSSVSVVRLGSLVGATVVALVIPWSAIFFAVVVGVILASATYTQTVSCVE